MQTIYTSQANARATVRAAVAAQTPVVWQFDNGDFAMSPNGASGNSTVAIYDSTNGPTVATQFLAQFPSAIKVIGNAGFATAYGSYGSADYSDDSAQQAAMNAIIGRSLSGTPIK